LVTRDETLVYCLTRDEALAGALETRLSSGLAFFYNDAARLNLAVALRAPDVVVVDTGAIRPEYGDAGLAPVLDALRERVPQARLAVRPRSGVEHFVAAEAGEGVELLPADQDGCVAAVSFLCAA
jgi:hypothetical protein